MKYRLSRALARGYLLVVVLLGVAGTAKGVPLEIFSGTTTLGPGVFQYDSITIHGRGRLNLLGPVTLNVTGDVQVLTELIMDPEGDFFSSGRITANSGMNAAQGTDADDGLDGLNGMSALSPNGHAGTPAGDGTAGGSFLQFIDQNWLTINSGQDVYIDGSITMINSRRGGNGGDGGTGGFGGDGYTSPIGVPGPGGDGGSGGGGGDGGDGGSSFTLRTNLVINAAGLLTLDTNSSIDTTSAGTGGHGGNARNGQTGGAGGDGRQTIEGSNGEAGNGGNGGNGGRGGNGARAGNGGHIFLQAPTINLLGQIQQDGARGGNGGSGHNGGQRGDAGRTTDLNATVVISNGMLGLAGFGGAGGDGGDGGDGGNLTLRGISITNTAAWTSPGGAAGLGNLGGTSPAGGQAYSGTDGSTGFDGNTITQLITGPSLEMPIFLTASPFSYKAATA